MRIVNVKHSVVYNSTITSGNLHGRSYKPCLLPMLVAFIIHIPFNFLNDINCSICNVFLHIMSYSTQVCVDMIYKKAEIPCKYVKAGAFAPALTYFTKQFSIFLPIDPYKSRSTHIYHSSQFATLYRTSSPLITVPKALPWHINSIFIIVLFLLVLPRNALFCKDSLEFCNVLDFTPILQIVMN